MGDLCLHLLLQVHEQEAASKTTIPYGVTASHPLLPYDDVHLSCLTWVTLLSSLYVAVFISPSLQGRSALLQASLAAPAYCTQRRSPVAAKFVWWTFELSTGLGSYFLRPCSGPSPENCCKPVRLVVSHKSGALLFPFPLPLRPHRTLPTGTFSLVRPVS